MGSFPSLLIASDRLEPQGAFAEAQAAFLNPDPQEIRRLRSGLEKHKVGIVAHFYMDAELQGVLSACDWPHIKVSDSLLMADGGIDMAKAGMERIVVLGVDFMSENVRAMLDDAGFGQIPVYRATAEPIGCSLAESAEALEYGAYLTKASHTPRSLHVIYINTSLDVKARSHHLVPTITCTSSNVVQTILQAASQIPGLNVWFGPDTYMGENLERLFEGLADLDDAAIKALHPAHDSASVRGLLERYNYFKQGSCIVHHMFGQDVVNIVRREYADTFITAHLEVPGEMFGLALEAQQKDAGVVGSTSNILSFIAKKVTQQAARGEAGRLRFVLGTEAGMVTSIVRSVQKILRETGVQGLEAEIIFPVASEAVAQTDDAELAVVPGVSGGEGCSTAGGCATCPYMKKNSLEALFDLVDQFGPNDEKLIPMYPRKYTELISGRSAASLGGEPILHMRALQRSGALPDALVRDVLSRGEESA